MVSVANIQIGWSLLSKVVSGFFGLLFLLIIPKYWGVEIYGNFSLFVAYITIAEIFFGNSINTAIKKEIAEKGFSPEGKRFFTQGLLVKTAIFFMGLLILFSFNIVNPIEIIDSNLIYFVILLFLMNYWGLIVNVLEISHNIQYVLVMYVLEYVTKFSLLVTLFFYQDFTLLALVYTMIGGYCIAFLYGGIVIVNKFNLHLKDFFIKFDWFEIRNLLKRTFHLALAVVSAILLTRIDLIIIDLFMPDSAVGQYALASEIARNSAMVGAAIIAGSLPLFASQDKRQKLFFIKKSKLLLYINIPISLLLLCLGTLFISIVYGSDFDKTPLILGIFCVYPILLSLQTFTSEILNIKGCTYAIFRNGIIAIAVNTLLSFMTVQIYGLVGVAVSTLIAYFVWFVLNRISLMKVLNN
jgi:O-antigen/teichoic acid export membrane protein